MPILAARARRPSIGQLAILFALALLAVLATMAAWPPPHTAGTAEGAPAAATTEAAAPAPAAAESPPAPPPQRVDTTPVIVADPSFEQRIEELVDLGVRTAQLAQDDEIAAAKVSDQQARARFAELMGRFADAGERALAALAAQPEPPVDPRDPQRRVVLQLVFAAECTRLSEQAAAANDRSRLDPLIQSILDVMPATPPLTEFGGRLLVDRPYLRSPHETSVLALVQLASEDLFPRDVATRLLLTLWDNLQRSGERSSDDLARLAMVLLADNDPGKRAAACRQLISDPRYRAMALLWLRQSGDKAVAAQVAGLAAAELAPADALAVLRELTPMLQRLPGAYLVLGTRAPELLADTYRELLASNTHPDVRTDLVAGAGLSGSPQALDIANLALQNDPSPDVRIQAGFAFSASGDPELGERALQQLLDDPVIARDPNRLGAIVLALQNFEAAAAINAIDRLGQRLRTMPLAEGSRQSLEALLARCLPGGAPSRPR